LRGQSWTFQAIAYNRNRGGGGGGDGHDDDDDDNNTYKRYNCIAPPILNLNLRWR
jgi:hypothetical protein